jgi:hypothetical protein
MQMLVTKQHTIEFIQSRTLLVSISITAILLLIAINIHSIIASQ